MKPIGYEWGVTDIEPAVPFLNRVMLRRTLDMVSLQLPSKSHAIVPVEVDADTETLINEIAAECGGNWSDEFIEHLLDHPIHIKTISKLRSKLAEKKTKALLELVEEYVEAGEPLVVFSAHLAPLRALAKKYGCPLITGDVDPAKRTTIIEDFQAGRVKLVGATIKAGGVGITLTAARHAIFLDLEWTPALNSQAEFRIYRIGQSRPVLIKYLVANHFVDERVTSVLLRKQAMISEAGL
jgi:SWI/SNF-related matrix-associated actin-dependent regulator 1 of chromatin subfamily A